MHRSSRLAALTVGALALTLALPALPQVLLGGTAQAAAPAASNVPASVPTQDGGRFHPLPAVRVVDTRVGLGATRRPLKAGQALNFPLKGVGGVPTDGVAAVALNVTVTGTVGPGALTVYATGQPRPLASILNFTTGQTVAVLTVAQVGPGVRVTLYSSGRSTELLVDVVGWYSTAFPVPTTAGLFNAVHPARIADTRSGQGAVTPGPGASVPIQVTGLGGVPATGVSAVVLNVTATGGSSRTYVTVYPTGSPRPATSNLNVDARQTLPNRVIVAVGAGGKVSLFNALGTQPLVVDVSGYYDDGTDSTAPGSYYTPVAPHRVLDTRQPPSPGFGPGSMLPVPVSGSPGVPAAGLPSSATVAVVSITALPVGEPDFLTAYRGGVAHPAVSDVNSAVGLTASNLVVVQLAGDGTFTLFNATSGPTVIVDVMGYFSGGSNGPAVAVSAGLVSSCALTTRGGVMCWGSNSDGELGNGTTIDSALPIDVIGLAGGVASVSVGWGRTCALTVAGAVWCWGGSTGDGTSSLRAAPVAVPGLGIGSTSVSAGAFSSCAVTSAGGVVCWGDNTYGELGDGSRTSSLRPVAVSGLAQGVASVSVGDGFACAVTVAGGAKCWGLGAESDLGNGGTGDQLVPVDVVGLSGPVQQVVAANEFACALTDAGGVECWGVNVSGQLGFGSLVAGSDAPVAAQGLSSQVISLSAGTEGACAVTGAGAAVCWGSETHGQVGDGGSTDRYVPTAVTGLGSGVTSVSSSLALSACAVTATGGLRCWGANQFGQLGVGGSADQSLPTQVVGFA